MDEDDYSEFWYSMYEHQIEVGAKSTVLQIPNEYMPYAISKEQLLNHIVDSFANGKVTLRSGLKLSFVPGKSINGIPVYTASNGGIEIHSVIDPKPTKSVRFSTSDDPVLEAIEKQPLSPESPRTRRAKGWHALAPKKGRERHELKARCGDNCFLRPEDEGFPICAALDRAEVPCAVDCRGLAAAKSRSHTLAPDAKARIPKLQEHFGCN